MNKTDEQQTARVFKPGDAVHWPETVTTISRGSVSMRNKNQHGTVVEVCGHNVRCTYGKKHPRMKLVPLEDLRHKGERDAFTEAFLKAFNCE